MTRLADTIRRFVETHGLTGPGVVAVSGGADSVALLRGLLEVGGDGLVVGHFNHRLRGDESDADEAFVRDLCERLGVPVRVGSADVAAVGGNLEATARRLRYDWLTQVARETRAAWVATGHTADDQAETLLHRIVRGTGVAGLRGIAARRPIAEPDGPWLVRPLLAATRIDVLASLESLGQPFRTDSMNADPAFTRSRIRYELLPLLKTFNPRVVDALARLADQAGETADELDHRIEQILRTCERPRAGPVIVLDASELAFASAFAVREVFRRIWLREGWPTLGMSAAHWKRLMDIAAGAVSAADFPDGVTARRVGPVVQLHQKT